MTVRDELSIKRPMILVTDMCRTGIRDSVRHNLRTLKVLHSNGSYQQSERLMILKMEELSAEIYTQECIIEYELYKFRGKYER